MSKDGVMSKPKLQMKLGVITSLMHRKFGGPVSVVKSHIDALKEYVEIKVFGLAFREEVPGIESAFPGAFLFKPGFPRRWFRGVGLVDALCEKAGSLDVLHVHMLWDHTVFAAWKAARLHRKPLVITPHGSVSEDWRFESFHKRLYRYFVLNRILNDASAVHALNQSEEIALRRFGYKGRIEIIPNGLPESLFETRISRPNAIQAWPQFAQKRVMLYMGRLWEGKGLDILIPAWAEVSKKAKVNGWQLVLAGPDYRGYEKKLKSLIASRGLENNVTFTGFLEDNTKKSLLAVAESFILPSHSEGFSMAILEAMAAGLPCIYTNKCNFPELEAAGGGFLTKDEVGPLADTISLIIKNSLGTNKSIGAKGRVLGKKQYTHKMIGQKLLTLYQSL